MLKIAIASWVIVASACMYGALNGYAAVSANSTSNASNASKLNWARMVYSCEARGQTNPWYTNTGNKFYFGPQFTSQTWHSEHGGPVREMGDTGKNAKPMRWYSISYIIRIAENTYRDQGPGAWPNCHGYLYG